MTQRSLRETDLNLQVEGPQLPQLRNFPQHIACEIKGLQANEVEGSSPCTSTSSASEAIDLIGELEVEELREFPPPTGAWARTSSPRPRRRRTVQTSLPRAGFVRPLSPSGSDGRTVARARCRSRETCAAFAQPSGAMEAS